MTRAVPMLVLLSGCATAVHHVSAAGGSVGWNESDGAQPVMAADEQVVLLGLSSETEYVDDAWSDFLSRCPGNLVDITATTKTELGFFAWRNQIVFEGTCLTPEDSEDAEASDEADEHAVPQEE